MRQILSITVKEDVSELRFLQKQHPGKYKPLQMLIALKQKGSLSKDNLALMTGSSTRSIQTWRTKYHNVGIKALLEETKGGKKEAAITNKVYEQLGKRLGNPQTGFRSFIEIQQWITCFITKTLDIQPACSF